MIYLPAGVRHLEQGILGNYNIPHVYRYLPIYLLGSYSYFQKMSIRRIPMNNMNDLTIFLWNLFIVFFYQLIGW